MNMEYIAQFNPDSCFLACLESFLKSNGIIDCTQKNLIDKYPDLCRIEEPNGKIRIGVVACNDGFKNMKDLCKKINIQFYDPLCQINNVDKLYPSLNIKCNYIFGIKREPNNLHAVLFDHVDDFKNIYVMDPILRHKLINNDKIYEDVIAIDVFKICYIKKEIGGNNANI